MWRVSYCAECLLDGLESTDRQLVMKLIISQQHVSSSQPNEKVELVRH